MRQVNGIYTQWINREYGKTGHVFQGRFKSILVEKESHLLELARYVVLNPVRANMVCSPREWRWSSYSATAGLSEIPGFLSIGWLLSQFDSDPPGAMRRYRKFVQQGRDVAVWDQLRSGSILGSDEYVNRLEPLFHAVRNVVEISRTERLAARPSLESIFAGAADRSTRNECIYEASRVHGYTLKEIGNHLGLYYSTVSTIAKRVAESRTPRKKI